MASPSIQVLQDWRRTSLQSGRAQRQDALQTMISLRMTFTGSQELNQVIERFLIAVSKLITACLQIVRLFQSQVDFL